MLVTGVTCRKMVESTFMMLVIRIESVNYGKGTFEIMVFVFHVICGAENSENLEKSLKCPFRWLTFGRSKSHFDPNPILN